MSSYTKNAHAMCTNAPSLILAFKLYAHQAEYYLTEISIWTQRTNPLMSYDPVGVCGMCPAPLVGPLVFLTLLCLDVYELQQLSRG